MSLYGFRKLYSDLVTADGTLAVVYLTWVTLLGRTYGRAGVEVYRPDGTRTVLLGADPAPLEPRTSEPLRIALPKGELVLAYAPVHRALDVGPATTCPSLHWSVLLARGAATLTIPELGALEGVGYVDWVTISRPTRTLGLRLLDWGRVHTPRQTLVYTSLEHEDGRRWQVSGAWQVGREDARVDGGVSVAIDDRGSGHVDAGPERVSLHAERVLHDGDAFGPERIASRADRLVVNALGGPTDETRWMGRATMADDEGRAVYERVRFGAAATERTRR